MITFTNAMPINRHGCCAPLAAGGANAAGTIFGVASMRDRRRGMSLSVA
jgi:hypothetical protein